MLAIGRALMSRPRLIMFDEPSLGLAPNIVERTFAIIRGIRDAGTTVLLVEQNAFAALEMCDHAYLLEGGRIVSVRTRRRDDRKRARAKGLSWWMNSTQRSRLRATKSGLPVCGLSRLISQTIVCARVTGVDLILVWNEGRAVACERVCPHEQADLSLGHLSDGRLFCPRHAASFDLQQWSIS